MTIYVDKENRCHLQNDGTMSHVQTDFFTGKCQRFVEGYRCFTDGDAVVIAPHEDYALLHTAQQVYDSQQDLRDRLSAIKECFEGLSSNPGLEQLMDFINTIREMMEDFDA